MKEIVIIGAGPAGMMAAGCSVSKYNSVTIIEKNENFGKKLSITGKGRCNVTNYCNNSVFLDNVVSNPKFLLSAINRFSCMDTIEFFNKLGLGLKIERGNRVFPNTDKAKNVVDALRKFVINSGCNVLKDKVKKVEYDLNKRKFIIWLRNSKFLIADVVVLATGGLSYPGTGSDGLGYTLARDLGHRITDLQPSLIPLCSGDAFIKDLQGLSLKNISIELKSREDNILYKDFGELLFTHFGMSGPVVLSASAHLSRFTVGSSIIEIDFKPALSKSKLDSRILRDFNEFKNRDFKNALFKLLPSKLIPVIVNLSGIDANKKCNSITKTERMKLIEILKHFKVHISNFRPIQEAIVTRGGVDVKEINPRTMQSKIVEGLYFAGEIMDVDAYTGGFNIQIALSTAYVAGKSISELK